MCVQLSVRMFWAENCGMYFDEIRFEEYVISYSQHQQLGGNSLVRWEQQTIVTVVSYSKHSNRCSRF